MSLLPAGVDVERADPGGADAVALLDELSDALAALTGASGRASFDPADVRGDRACFVVARAARGARGEPRRAVGCGALRPLVDAPAGAGAVGEIKRMFARPGSAGEAGAGRAVLAFLEAEAARLGYAALWLETRAVNTRAVAFYERHGYARIANDGRYVGEVRAVCFGKRLAAGARVAGERA